MCCYWQFVWRRGGMKMRATSPRGLRVVSLVVAHPTFIEILCKEKFEVLVIDQRTLPSPIKALHHFSRSQSPYCSIIKFNNFFLLSLGRFCIIIYAIIQCIYFCFVSVFLFPKIKTWKTNYSSNANLCRHIRRADFSCWFYYWVNLWFARKGEWWTRRVADQDDAKALRGCKLVGDLCHLNATAARWTTCRIRLLATCRHYMLEYWKLHWCKGNHYRS